MSRGHGVTFAGGALTGLVIGSHVYLVFGAGILAGAVLVFVLVFARELLELVRACGGRLRTTNAGGGGVPVSRPAGLSNPEEYARVQREQRRRLWEARGER